MDAEWPFLDEVPVRHYSCMEILQRTTQAREEKRGHEEGTKKKGSPEAGLWGPILGFLEPLKIILILTLILRVRPKMRISRVNGSVIRDA